MNRRNALIAWAVTFAGATAVAPAKTITQWNFNSPSPDSNTNSGSTLPSVGSGSVAPIGGTTATFAGSTGSSDPAAGDNSGYQLTDFPAQGAGNKAAGLRWLVSTSGYKDIVVKWDLRHSNAAANTARFQYTTDATIATPVWVDYAPAFVSSVSGTPPWTLDRTADLSAITSMNNNTKAGFRVVAEFATPNAYAPASTSSAYASNGTWRFDMVTVSGTTIPEPATLTVLGLAGMALRRRRY